MNILAHRGFWSTLEEKNSIQSLTNAIGCNWGIETDIRDYNGKLVISHDIPTSSSEMVEIFFENYYEGKHNEFLALNIKSDGIQTLLLEQLYKYHIENYAVFDMSIPEQVVYDRLGMKYFTRQSDLEVVPVMYEKALGVWIDTWYEEWITAEIICDHLEKGKNVAVISPEIHGRDECELWNILKNIHSDKLWLCTDKPKEAERFFNE